MEKQDFGNTAFRVNVRTALAGLQADLQKCLEIQWKEHFNTADYSGSWTAISLRSQSGNSTDINAYDNGSPFVNTALMASCPHIAALLDTLQFEKETVRLL